MQSSPAPSSFAPPVTRSSTSAARPSIAPAPTFPPADSPAPIRLPQMAALAQLPPTAAAAPFLQADPFGSGASAAPSIMPFEPYPSPGTRTMLPGPGGYFMHPASYSAPGPSFHLASVPHHPPPINDAQPNMSAGAPFFGASHQAHLQPTAEGFDSPSIPQRRRGSSVSSLTAPSVELNGMPPYYDPIKHRRRTTQPQLQVLEAQFAANSKPDPTRRRELSNELGMTPREIQVWFQNRRAKQKKLNKRAQEDQVRTGEGGLRPIGIETGEGGEGLGASRRGSMAVTAYTVSSTESGASSSRRSSQAPMFAAASVVPPMSAPPSRRASGTTASATSIPAPPMPWSAPASRLAEQAFRTDADVPSPSAQFAPHPSAAGFLAATGRIGAQAGEGYVGVDARVEGQGVLREAIASMAPPAPPVTADEMAWRRRGSNSMGSDVVTPLTAEFSFGTGSHTASSATSFDGDFDLRRRSSCPANLLNSSCPADLLNSMSTVVLSHRTSAVAGLHGMTPSTGAGEQTPQQQQHYLGRNPIVSWSSAVPPSMMVEDPSPRAAPDQWITAPARRHSVSTVPRQDPGALPSLEPYVGATSNSPEVARSPLPAHVYPHYNSSRASSGSSLLPIDEHDHGPVIEEQHSPSRGSPNSPFDAFQRTLSSPAGLGFHRPSLQRRPRSQVSMSSGQQPPLVLGMTPSGPTPPPLVQQHSGRDVAGFVTSAPPVSAELSMLAWPPHGQALERAGSRQGQESVAPAFYE